MNRADSFDHVTKQGRGKPERLFTFSSGGWVLLISFVLCLLAAATVLRPLWTTGFHRAIGDGRNPDTYGFDLSNLTIPRATLVASGVSKDQIKAIVPSLVETLTPAEVKLRNENEREQGLFLVSSDRVIGVDINGETRAYPLRVLSYHELINDVVGGVPIGATYSPLCDSAMVFDRRIDGQEKPPLEFGVSGLLANSDLVMFDRRGDGKKESLWPQLALHAVSGPLAGQPLKLVKFDLVTWKRWLEMHPDARVVEGLRTFKQQYKMEPYNSYLSVDDLKFPVFPLWSKEGVPKKTRVIVVSSDGGKRWKAMRAGYAGAENAPSQSAMPAPADEIRLYSFVCAWYAQHPDDTDYSAVVKTK